MIFSCTYRMSYAYERARYPQHGDPEFAGKLMSLREYQMFKIPDVGIIQNEDEFLEHSLKVCKSFDKLHQHFIEHYLSHRSPYKSMLLFHSLGVGKTCSAITVAEAMLTGHSSMDGPSILVISSKALHESFEEQIKGECTDSFYTKLAHNDHKRMADIIKSRYKFITYDGIIAYAAKNNGIIHGKTIIVDEAHNLRTEENKDLKESATALEKLIRNSASVKGMPSNRVILLSATPMYDKPYEIFWLLGLLLKNDGIKTKGVIPDEKNMYDDNDQLTLQATQSLRRLAGEYVSYIKSKSPFTFAKRLSPVASGIPVYEAEWTNELTDGLVVTPPGDLQGTSLKHYQSTNITYPTHKKGGDEAAGSGFYHMFNKKNVESFQVDYSEGYTNALMPVPDKLGRIAAKMMRICELISESEGIVIVYSRFIYDGILPLAIALEHMGLRRYGQDNILARATLMNTRSPKLRNAHYAILSADKDLMRNTSIKELLNVVNSSKNTQGSKVKVVLLTQVAGEGLSLHNVREVHILEPWFHMNRMDQVIGRAIRTCSHQSLPLNQRNVTVFLHALDTENASDLHIYRSFVVKKLSQIQQVENIIRTNAVDCSIMRNINYHPKSNFPFTTIMRTSRGASVTVQFGNEDNLEYQCSARLASGVKDVFTRDMYSHMIPLVVKRITKVLCGNTFVPLHTVEAAVGLDTDVFNASLPYVLYPNTPMTGYRVYKHLHGLFVQQESSIVQQTLVKFKLPTTSTDTGVNDTVQNVEDFIRSLPTVDAAVLAHELYRKINEKTWDDVAQACITNPTHKHITTLMRAHGLFVYANELSQGSANKPIGYVDIFNTKDEGLVVTLYDVATGKFRQANDNEVELIKQKRKVAWTTKGFTQITQAVGVFMPEKRGTTVAKNNFKILMPTTSTTAGKKTGKVCTYYSEPQLSSLLAELKSSDTKKSKHELCIELGFELLRKNRLWVYPQWKPT